MPDWYRKFISSPQIPKINEMLLLDIRKGVKPLTYLKWTNHSNEQVILWKRLMLVECLSSFCFLPRVSHGLGLWVHNGDWLWLEIAASVGIWKDSQRRTAGRQWLVWRECAVTVRGVSGSPHISVRFKHKKPGVFGKLSSSSWVC